MLRVTLCGGNGLASSFTTLSSMTLPLFRRALALAVSLTLGVGMVAIAAPAAHAAPSPEAAVSSLTMSVGGTWTTPFDPNVAESAFSVSSDTASIAFTAVLNDPTSTMVTFNGWEKVTTPSGVTTNTAPLRFGINTLSIDTVSQSGRTMQYVITVTRAAAPIVILPNVELASLSATGQDLAPAFASGTTEYSVAVPYTTTSIEILASAVVAENTVVVKDSGNVERNTIPLGVGSNLVLVTVTAPANAASKVYTLHITRGPAPTANVDLASIGLSVGTLSPAFDASVLNYEVRVPYAVRTVEVSATAAITAHTITINNDAIAEGQSKTVTVNYDANGGSAAIMVRAANGANQSYNVTIKRDPPSNNAEMTNLVFSGGALDPATPGSISDFTANVPYLMNSATFSATVTDPTAKLRVNDGYEVASGTPSRPVALKVGVNTVTVTTTAEDTVTTTSRTITVTRAAPNLELSSLSVAGGTLSPAFAGGTTAYTLALPYTSSSVNVAAAAVESAWRLSIQGQEAAASVIAVPVGASTIAVTVTALYGESRSYTIRVTREAASSDARLSGITLSSGTLSPAFAASQTAYTATVAHNVETINIGAQAASSFATVAINGMTADPAAVALATGKNTITVSATAQNGSTSTTTIVVTREAAPAADLDITLGFSVGDPSANAPLAVSGANLLPGSTATLTMHSSPVVLATGTVRANGTITLSARIPANAELGSHRLVFDGVALDGSAVSTTAWFTAMRNGTIGGVSYTAAVPYVEPTTAPTPGATPAPSATASPAAAKPAASSPKALASTGVEGGTAALLGIGLAMFGALTLAVNAVRRYRRRTAA